MVTSVGAQKLGRAMVKILQIYYGGNSYSRSVHLVGIPPLSLKESLIFHRWQLCPTLKETIMAKHTQKQLQAIIKNIVAEFECDGTSDYARMDAAVYEATQLRLDNKSLWNLVNRAKAQVERISFTLED